MKHVTQKEGRTWYKTKDEKVWQDILNAEDWLLSGP